jgi:HEAT repeat protein
MNEATTAVSWLLRQPEVEARRLGAQQLPKVDDDQASELLLLALADDDWRVRKEAAVAAPKIKMRARVIASLVATLEEKENIGLRNAVVEALVGLGSEVFEPLVDAMTRLDEGGRKLAVEVLAELHTERSVHHLVLALSDEDANVRCAAIEALGNASRGDETARKVAIEALLSTLGCQEDFMRLSALESLSRLGAEIPWRAIEPFVRDPLMRRFAVMAAGGSDAKAALETLAEAVCDPSRSTAREALLALGKRLRERGIRSEFGDWLKAQWAGDSAVLTRLRDLADRTEDKPRSAAAVLALGLLGHVDDLEVILHALEDPERIDDGDIALRAFGPEALSELKRLMQGKGPDGRALILTIVPEMRDMGAEQLREMALAFLDDGEPTVLEVALALLASSGTEEDFPVLDRYSCHDEPGVAMAASTALLECASRLPGAARSLLRSQGNPRLNPSTYCILVLALARAGFSLPDDLAILRSSLRQDDPRTRRMALDAMACLQDVPAADIVQRALHDKDRAVRLSAIRALESFRCPEKLLELFEPNKSEPTVMAALLHALSRIDEERTHQAAQSLLESADSRVVLAVVDVIGQLPGEGKFDVLYRALDHGDPAVVRLALGLLATAFDSKGKDKVEFLQDRLEREGNPTMRRAIEEVLRGSQQGAKGS